jgi:hypothetical protein
VFAEYKNKKANEIYSSADVIHASATQQDINENADTDGDGSEDWEEILFETDPNDAKSKPNKEKSPLAADLTKPVAEKLSQIDIVSREFFAKYMQLRQIGASTDKASQEDLALTTTNGIVLSRPADYNINQIIIKTNSDRLAIETYGREINAIFKKYAVNSRNEAVIAKDSMEKEDPLILKEIDPIIISYKNIINSLIKVIAPQSMSVAHLDLINAINGSLFIAQSFRNSDVDAIKGVQAIAYYQVVEKKLLDTVTTIRSDFKNIGINENIF